jgi:outer membrane protein assembly factor BamE (lipoprotein component of BamABCDE complex)
MTKLLIALSFLALAACASTGNTSIANQDGTTIGGKIRVGATNEDGVRQAFGDPQSTQYLSNGDTVWTYDYTHVASDPQNFIPIVSLFDAGTNGFKKELVVEFDSNKVVKNYSMNKSAVQTSAGIMG